MAETPPSSLSSRIEVRRISEKDINLQVTEENLLGNGAFGIVIKTNYAGTPVAAKTLHMFSNPVMYGLFPNSPAYQNIIKEFEHELFTNANLSHPNVIQLIGVVYNTTTSTGKPQNNNTPKWMIQELGETSLEKELQNNPLLQYHHNSNGNSNNNNTVKKRKLGDINNINQNNRIIITTTETSIPEPPNKKRIIHALNNNNNNINNNFHVLKLKLEILRDILRGLSFMHHYNIAHRDLKPANILKVNNTYKLADLGIAKVIQMNNYHQQYLRTATGTPLYVAPEVTDNSKYTLKCDIYSFGVMMIELILNEPPSLHTRSTQLNRAIQIVVDFVSLPSHSTPPLPSSTNQNSPNTGFNVNDNLTAERIIGFITSLIEVNYKRRPSALDALSFIELLLSRFLSPPLLNNDLLQKLDATELKFDSNLSLLNNEFLNQIVANHRALKDELMNEIVTNHRIVKDELMNQMKLEMDQKFETLGNQISSIFQLLQSSFKPPLLPPPDIGGGWKEMERVCRGSSRMINYDNMQLICSFSLPFSPRYIAVDNHHPPHIIISGTDHKIHIYSLPPYTTNNDDVEVEDGRGWMLVRSFGGNGNMQFKYPTGVAVLHHEEYECHSSGRGDIIIIADRDNNRIQIWSWEGEFIRSFGGEGSGHLQFNNPYGVALMHTTSSSSSPSSKPHIIISDCWNHRIQIWSVEGEFIRSFGSKGSANMQFKFPTGVAVHRRSGHIIICDSGNNRIQICSVEGVFIRSLGSDNMQFSNPFGVAVLHYHHRHHFLSTHHNYKGDDDQIIISDHNNRIQIWSVEGEFIRLFGSKGSANMQFIYPWGVAVLHGHHTTHPPHYNNNDNYGSTHIIIADAGNKRIQIIGEPQQPR